jgi:hypothetical protein
LHAWLTVSSVRRNASDCSWEGRNFTWTVNFKAPIMFHFFENLKPKGSAPP